MSNDKKPREFKFWYKDRDFPEVKSGNDDIVAVIENPKQLQRVIEEQNALVEELFLYKTKVLPDQGSVDVEGFEIKLRSEKLDAKNIQDCWSCGAYQETAGRIGFERGARWGYQTALTREHQESDRLKAENEKLKEAAKVLVGALKHMEVKVDWNQDDLEKKQFKEMELIVDSALAKYKELGEK